MRRRTKSVAALFLWMAGAAPPQLQTVLRWPEHFPDRHLDDSRRYQLADLSDYGVAAAAGAGEFRRPDSNILADALCRSYGRSSGSAEDASVDSGTGRAAVASPGDSYTRQSHQHPRGSVALRVAGAHQRL